MRRKLFAFHRAAILCSCVAAIAPDAGAQLIAGPFTRDNSTYYLTTPMLWPTAEAVAVSLGGHLLTVSDAAEEAWALSTFSPFISTGSVYIGFTGNGANVSSWQWVSGEPVVYTNWCPGEPNGDFNGCEMHAEMGACWNDRDGLGACTADPLRNGVIEICTLGPPPDAQWQQTLGGTWQDTAPWQNGAPPTEGQAARFAIGAQSYTIGFVDDALCSGVKVVSDAVTLALAGRSLTSSVLIGSCASDATLIVAPGAADTASLRLEGGDAVVLGPVRLGVGAVSQGTLTIGLAAKFGPTPTVAPDVRAGEAGTGRLIVEAGGLARLDEFDLGTDAGGSGECLAQTAGRVAARRVRVGAADGGAGEFSLLSGGTAEFAESFDIGAAQSSTGEATIGGAASALDAGAHPDAVLRVGMAPLAQGALTSENGALVRAGSVLLGTYEDGAGPGSARALVRSGGRLIANKTNVDALAAEEGLRVGNSAGLSSLVIEGGGVVTATSALVQFSGGANPADPVLRIDGGASVLECSGAFYAVNHAQVRLENGARLTTHRAWVAPSSSFPDTEIVLDHDSSWESDATVRLGDDNAGPGAQALVTVGPVASFRCRDLQLEAYGSITGAGSNPIGIRVTSGPQDGAAKPGVECATFLFTPLADLSSYTLDFGPGAGLGGTGTWPTSLTNPGVVVAGLPDRNVRPNDPSANDFTIAGDFMQTPGGVVRVAIANSYFDTTPNPADGFCCNGNFAKRLVVQGVAHLGATLRVELSNGNFGHAPFLIGAPTLVLDAASLEGTFDRIELDPLLPSNRVRVTYDAVLGEVVVTLLPPIPCAGDANADNTVDFLDLNQILSDFGLAEGGAGTLLGDVNLDGVCDFIDLNIVLSAFGSSC